MSDPVIKFWMVWREGTPYSRFHHETKEAALQEAERIAGLAPGEVVYVVKTVAAVRRPVAPVERPKLTTCEIPF